jgi:hypothetical protein
MEEKKASKIWSSPLNAKTCKYYAIKHFVNPEKTWNAYFKSMKCLEGIVACIESEKYDEKSLRKAVSLGNELSESYEKESITRMVSAMVSSRYLPEAKTLLEWLGLYWKHEIPEAKLNDVPWAIELADKLQEFNCRKKG